MFTPDHVNHFLTHGAQTIAVAQLEFCLEGVNQKLKRLGSKSVTNGRRASNLVQLKRTASESSEADTPATGCHKRLEGKTTAARQFL